MRTQPSPTEYFDDFLAYYKRAKILEDRNHRAGKKKTCGDPLQDNVTIYDTVHRRYAGFSNVLRDLHAAPNKKWKLPEWLFVYGIHRMTGSGASFFPKSEGPRRHGYCNVIAPHLATLNTIPQMVEFIRDYEPPMFTSYGNQPPPFPSPEEPYRTGGRYYFCEIWPELVMTIVDGLDGSDGPSVASMCDWIFSLHKERGLKQFKFTHTAFVMDIADWHPKLIRPNTQCYYGANCLLAMNAMFSDNNRPKGKQFYHGAMDQLVEACSKILGEEAAPMDVEDCACDAVRYWNRFVPKFGYEHLTDGMRHTLSNISLKQFHDFCAS